MFPFEYFGVRLYIRLVLKFFGIGCGYTQDSNFEKCVN